MKRRLTALLLAACMCLSISASALTTGTYTGEAMGVGGPVKVEVTFDGNTITAVKVVEHKETEGIGTIAIAEIPQAIVEKQSIAIDTVSSATITSNAILEAVADCIVQAGGDVKDFQTAAESTADNTMVPGIYAGTAMGMREEITVHVTVSEDAILAVDVVKCNEQPALLNEAPLAEIPAAIVANQSTNVDAVTGATFTSLGIMNATRDALAKAGNVDGFKTKVTHEVTKGEDVTTDILVVGGGGAGSIAAISAKYPALVGADNGLNVMLIEKQGFLGGNTMLSGGWYGIASPLTDSSANLDAYLPGVLEGLAPDVSKALTEQIYRISSETILNMQLTGLSVIDAFAMHDASEYAGYPLSWAVGQVDTTSDHDMRWAQGWRLGQYFKERLTNSDVDVRLNTAADKLLLDDNGAVIGVHATTKDAEYNIYAKKVILATGGFANNPEMIEEYCPQFSNIIAYVNASSTGDAFAMCKDVDAVVYVDRAMKNLGTDVRYGIWSDLNEFHCLDGYVNSLGSVNESTQGLILINTDGDRFCFDGTGYATGGTFDAIIQQPGKTSFAIIDANHPYAYVAEASKQEAYRFKAETIDQLAEAIGVPAEKLNATVAAYNASIESGEVDEFGVAANQKHAVLEAPYYAVVVNPILPAIYAGMQVDDNCQIMNSKGETVENLFGAGDTCNATGSIGAVGAAIYTGRIAGENAAAQILGK